MAGAGRWWRRWRRCSVGDRDTERRRGPVTGVVGGRAGNGRRADREEGAGGRIASNGRVRVAGIAGGGHRVGDRRTGRIAGRDRDVRGHAAERRRRRVADRHVEAARRRVPGGIDGRAGDGRRTECEGLTGGVVAGGGQFAVDRVARRGREVDARPARPGGLGRQVAGEDQHRCRGVGDRHGEGARRGIAGGIDGRAGHGRSAESEDVTRGVVARNGQVTVDRVARGGREADARPTRPGRVGRQVAGEDQRRWSRVADRHVEGARRRVPGGIDRRAGNGRGTDCEGVARGVVAGHRNVTVDRVARGDREVDARPTGSGCLGRQVARQGQDRRRRVGDRDRKGAARR